MIKKTWKFYREKQNLNAGLQRHVYALQVTENLNLL